MKIIWPSADFMRRCHVQRLPHPLSAPPFPRQDSQDQDEEGEGGLVDLGENEQVFCLPSYMAQMGWDIQTQLHQYAPAQTRKALRPLAPHHKTYLRLLGGSSQECAESQSCTCQDVAWLLLTSACLSKGGGSYVLHVME